MIAFVRRTLYLAYYARQLDRGTFQAYFRYVQQKTGRSSWALWSDVIGSVYRHNVGLMDYFVFRFHEKDDAERSAWVGTGYKYEFDLKMNPKSTRGILENKLAFYEAYAPFIRHAHCSVRDMEQGNAAAIAVLTNPSGKVVLKDATGQCGWEVEVVEVAGMTAADVASHMKSKGYDAAEAFVEQHPDIARLSPSGLNTVRVITVVNNAGGVDILGARMRLSVDSHVDNLAAGNIACPVDLETGTISGPGVYSDPTKDPVTHHPVTGVELVGYPIPFWDDILESSRRIALHRPENRAVGWDVAVTADGPDFIEGNHNWCKILWQLPVGRGLKSELQPYE